MGSIVKFKKEQCNDGILSKVKETFRLDNNEIKLSNENLKKYIREANIRNIYGIHDILLELLFKIHSSIKLNYEILRCSYCDSHLYKQNCEIFKQNLLKIDNQDIFPKSLLYDDDDYIKLTNFLIYDIASEKFDENITLCKDSNIINYSFLYNFIKENEHFRFKHKLTLVEKNILDMSSKCYNINEIKDRLHYNRININEFDINYILNIVIPEKLGFNNIIQVMTLYHYIFIKRYHNVPLLNQRIL